MLRNAFDNPALLAYYGLADQSSAAKKAKSGVMKAAKSAISAVKTGGITGALEAISLQANKGLINATESKSMQNLIRTACMGNNLSNVAQFVKTLAVDQLNIARNKSK
jgi:hypothetical protein